MHEDFIADRCALDGIVYTDYLFSKQKIPYATWFFASNVYDKLIGKYDLVFYIPPEFEPAEDGVRSNASEFRDNIIERFDRQIEKLKEDRNIDVIYLTGSVRERVEQVLKKMEWFKNEYK